LQVTAYVKSKTKRLDFMELPSVERILANSTKAVNGILRQTGLMESALYTKHNNLQADMSKLKAQYEKQLGLQQQEIDEITASIAALSAKIQRTKMNNTILQKHSADVQHDSSLLRIQLKTLESKVQTAKVFIARTLDYTDDTSSEDVAILNTPEPIFRPKPHPNELVALGSSDTVEDAIDYIVYGRHGNKQHESGNKTDEGAEVDTFDDVAEAPAFLQVGAAAGAKGKASYPDIWRYMHHARDSRNVSKVASQSAKTTSHFQKQYLAAIQTSPNFNSLLIDLKSKMGHFEAENRNSIDYMRTSFEEHYKVGLQRRSFLMASKERKEANLKSLESLNTKLRTADAALDKTHEELQTRIKGLKLFLSKLSSGSDK